MPRNNCLFFAITEVLKENKYVVIRKSRHNHKWPICHYHFLVIPKEIVDKYALSFIPEKETLGDYPCPFFKGSIVKGDK